MKNNKSLCCCFTGHRPKKLTLPKQKIKEMLSKAIDKAILLGYTTFITGMAPGTDTWAAEIVLERKANNKALKLVCAIPYPKFISNSNENEKNKYNYIIKNADHVEIVCDHYFKACFQQRNIYMVNHSSLVIALWNGSASGTKNTIDYAKRNNVKIINILNE